MYIYRSPTVYIVQYIKILSTHFFLRPYLEFNPRKGIEWSKTHYAGGYTSYFSLPALQKWVPPIQKLEEWLEPHVQEFRKDAWQFLDKGEDR